MRKKRVTIYDIAKELEVSASYVSKALNDHPSLSFKSKEKIRKKARELNYKPNSLAANFRSGNSKTIGVVVPSISHKFFSDAIAGIEDICFEHNHSLIICQSRESFDRECKAINTLIEQNVDCVIISISAETDKPDYLQLVLDHNIRLIQFDRCMETVESIKVLNDSKSAAYKVTKNLIEEGYKRLAFLGGPSHIITFRERKNGFIQAIEEYEMMIPYNHIVEDALSSKDSMTAARQLLLSKYPPDAFVTVSDHQSLSVLQVAKELKIKIPEELGIFGFANEDFSSLVEPGISSVDQKSNALGQKAIKSYFDTIDKNLADIENYEEIVLCEIQIRDSSRKKTKVKP